MDKPALKHLLAAAAGREPADLVIRNCRVVNVFTGEILPGEIAVAGEHIAGIGAPGEYRGQTEYDAGGRFAAPGLIDSHIHIESSFLSPAHLARLLVPHGTAVLVADPHEITNVCGAAGIDFMMRSAALTPLRVKFMLPSCVPATPFEHAGADFTAADMAPLMPREEVLGLGEFMDYVSLTNGEDAALDKILLAQRHGKRVDGHSVGLDGKILNAYAAAGVCSDHECDTVEAMRERLRRGMYVMLRDGSACHDLATLLKGVTPENARRCLFCVDDLQPRMVFRRGHLNHHLRTAVAAGIDAVTALRMATLNPAECYHLDDAGALAPGRRADVTLFDDLREFTARAVWIGGKLCAENGRYLPEIRDADCRAVKASVHLAKFREDDLRLHLSSPGVNVIEYTPGTIVTRKGTATVKLTPDGDFQFDPAADIVKIAVIERHHDTGHVGLGLLKGYGIKHGAIAITIAHDSHNIIAAGVSNAEIALAVKTLVQQEGGAVIVRDGKTIAAAPLPIAGLMAAQGGEAMTAELDALHDAAVDALGITNRVEPIMPLCFMALPVIPELKITDMGLFDVTRFKFIPVERG